MEQTTLITGAGKRIGAAIARHLAAQGHNLVLHYHHSHREAEALREALVASKKIEVTLVQANLEDTPALETFWNGLPPVTNIIHNASRYVPDQLENFSPASLRAHLALHVEAPLLLTQGFLAQLPAGVTGNSVVLGDGAMGWSVAPQFFTYAASKYAWASLIDLLAAAAAPRARANLIALAPTLPGEMDSPALFDRLAARAPLQRTGAVEDVLQAIDFVLANASLTGQVLGLGNGMALATARPPAVRP